MSIGAEVEQDTLVWKVVITKSIREDLPLGEIWVGKFTDCISPMKSQNSFTEVPWLVRERYQHPAKFHDDN